MKGTRLPTLCILLSCIWGCHHEPATEATFVGTYSATRFVNGKPVDESKLPVGQWLILVLNSDKTWVLRDFMVGFNGNWKLKSDGNLELIQTEGASGKLPKPITIIVKPSPDRGLMRVIAPAESAGTIEFHYDPTIGKRISDGIERAMGDSRQNP